MNSYTVVALHDSGLGWIVHIVGNNADDALKKFDMLNRGIALAVFDGHLENQVKRNLWQSRYEDFSN